MTLRHLRWRGLVAALAVLVLSLSISGADARTGQPDARAAVAGSVRAAVESQAHAVGKGKYGIPPIADMDPNTGNPVPYAGKAVTDTTSSKTKVTIKLPEIVTSTYANFCLAFPTGDGPPFETCCPDPTSTPCDPINPPASDYDNSFNVNWYAITGPTWVNSPKGVRPTFGTFPSVQVSALAFGSIPVTATVSLNQSVGADGYYSPLGLDYSFSSEFPVGTTVQGYGKAPESPFVPDGGSFVYLPSRLSGKVDIRLSNLAVDGRPVDVGSSCRTAAPASLTLGSPGGFSGKPGETTQPSDYYGRPGSFTTNPGSQLYGNLDIPRFTGCTNGRENFDRLLTSFVSAPRNPVTVTLTATLDVCTVDTEGCPQVPTLPPPPAAQERRAKAAAAAAPTTSPIVARYTPAVRSRLVRAIASLPARLRNGAVTALPLAVRGPVLDGLKRLR